MSTPFRMIALVFVTAVAGQASVFAHTPVDFLEVLEVEPANPIEHGVELKSKLDSDRAETDLAGPQFFSRAVGCLGRSAKATPCYLNWFRIVDPAPAKPRNFKVLDMVRGGADKTLAVASAEFYLTPAQLITSGEPDPIPDGLDHYKAYRIVEPPQVDRDVTITVAGNSSTRRLGKPIFLCVAAEQWHHADYAAATHPNDCFVIYELNDVVDESSVSTIDQFGLNQLGAKRSRWLCVRAALLGAE